MQGGKRGFLFARVAMLGEYACGTVGGHIEETYLEKDKMMLTNREESLVVLGRGEQKTGEGNRELIIHTEFSLGHAVPCILQNTLFLLS